MGKCLIIYGAISLLTLDSSEYNDDENLFDGLTFEQKSITSSGLGDSSTIRVSCAPVPISSLGLSVGDYLQLVAPTDVLLGHRQGSSSTNVSTNTYWHYTTKSTSDVAGLSSNSYKKKSIITISSSYICFSFALNNGTLTFPDIDVADINSMIAQGTIRLVKVNNTI